MLSIDENEELNSEEQSTENQPQETPEADPAPVPPKEEAQETAPVEGEPVEVPAEAENEAPVEASTEEEVAEPVTTSEEAASVEAQEEEAAAPVSEPTEEASQEVEEAASTPEVDTSESVPVEASAEAPSEGGAEEAPAFSEEEMLSQIDHILSQENNLDVLIEQATPNELLLMLEVFNKSGEVKPFIRRVGLMKRRFDDLTEKQEVPANTQGRFSTALAVFNKRRQEYQTALDEQKGENTTKKKELIEKLKVIVEAEEMNRHDEVRELQEAWKKIGPVTRNEQEEIVKSYKSLLDQYYQQREVHRQLMEYDRQINLKEKERLLEELETLLPSEEEQNNREIWRERSEQLTELQLRWRSTGFIPREDMDRINQRYRELLDSFFNTRSSFYAEQDEQKGENGQKKRELLEKMQPYTTFSSEKPKEWNKATDELRKLQEEWKAIGRASQEENSELWKAYRAVGNAFFGAKSAFFKKLDEVRQENLVQKRELCEKAEGILEAADWENGARELKKLQKDWKTIGPVPDRHSNRLWNRFRQACDAYFEKRREHFNDQHSEEIENLQAKRALIDAVRAVSVEKAGSRDDAIKQIKDIQAKWKEVGRVPYREKDVIWKEFRAEVDQFFDDLRQNRDRTNYSKRQRASSKVSSDPRIIKIQGKISKLKRRISQAREKVDAYSTNIEFISKGKSGDALRQRIQQEIDQESKNIEEMNARIIELEESMVATPEPEPKEEPTAEAAAEGETVATPAETEETPSVEAEVPVEEAPASEAAVEEAPAKEDEGAPIETPEADATHAEPEEPTAEDTPEEAPAAEPVEADAPTEEEKKEESEEEKPS
ncbi:MAG: DUF349 domain-containing protein [Bacteroidota bacterium]